MTTKSEISLLITDVPQDIELIIYEEQNNSLFELDQSEADNFGESQYQILEGKNYNYYFKNNLFQLKEINGIVINSKRLDVSEGRITPNIYVGTLTLFVIKKDDPDFEKKISIEVLATKMDSQIDKSYRENYRFMLDSITEKCTELLMQINSPIEQSFEIDFHKDCRTIYQRFTFVKTLIDSIEFKESLQKILSSPCTAWKNNQDLKDIRSIRKFSNSSVRQLITSKNRIEIDQNLFISKKYQLTNLPRKILSNRKAETVDTPENRFIKNTIEVFLKFLEDCYSSFQTNNYSRALKETKPLIIFLENILNQPFFKEISRPTTLKLNSPILQRKSGYKEILNAWLKYNLAAKLIWNGSNDVFEAGKRDIAVLYEYWLFFTLYDLIKEKFKIDKYKFDDKPYDHLIVPTNDGLNVMLKSGKHTALEGVFDSGYRKLQVKFSYNRTFSGGTEYINRLNKKLSGSWTKTLRPDYTLSFWPAEINEEEAEEKELIVHIHFDSKYKLDQFIIKTNSIENVTSEDLKSKIENQLNQEKEEEKMGKYKHADLMKMHAYKDAIRRTGGAYILYPGTESIKPLKGFHEIIPGLGAFAIRPTKLNNGVIELSQFIDNVINHLLDRASQRENAANKLYEIHKNKKEDYLEDNVTPNILNDSIPEYFDENRSLKIIPDETYILVGYCKEIENLNWYQKQGLYNFRMDDDKGSLILSNEVVNAKYLLIREVGNILANRIYKIISIGPKVLTGLTLQSLGYKTKNVKNFYLVVEIEKELCKDFDSSSFNFTELEEYKKIQSKYTSHIAAGIPFTTTLTKLMRTKVR
jgi:predicted component of viral defense system (DUF524 family)